MMRTAGINLAPLSSSIWGSLGVLTKEVKKSSALTPIIKAANKLQDLAFKELAF